MEISRVSGPGLAGQMALPGRCIHGITGREDRVIFPIMSLRRAHVANAAVAVLDVVSINEAAGPLLRGFEIREGLRPRLQHPRPEDSRRPPA